MTLTLPFHILPPTGPALNQDMVRVLSLTRDYLSATDTSIGVITAWVSFTPTGGWNTNTTYTGKWRRVGENMEVQFKIACTGAPNNATPTAVIPSGYTIDTAKLVDATADQTYVGRGLAVDAGTAFYVIDILYNSTTELKFRSHDVVGSDILLGQMNSNILPFSFGSGDYIHGFFSVPISGWGVF